MEFRHSHIYRPYLKKKKVHFHKRCTKRRWKAWMFCTVLSQKLYALENTTNVATRWTSCKLFQLVSLWINEKQMRFQWYNKAMQVNRAVFLTILFPKTERWTDMWSNGWKIHKGKWLNVWLITGLAY